ncbi:uncharacterized protein LOC125516072 isoform X2 [Triticum urartu]|uniref:uncharacterized protein LOC125516072 isoform X2 n=1 Tax=Triticum urartu TaxID=4572 RepID=UPI002042DA47|nr:uncharacterized protein LOC125516072 isoform X2 [Triticum urartu]
MSSPAPNSQYSGSNAFNLQIVVEAFFCTSPDGRKIYVKGRNLLWTVVVEKFSVDALTRQLALELNIGTNQLVLVSYFDKVLGENVRLLHDEQHYLMFDMYAAELKVPLSVVVVDVIGSSVFNGGSKIADFVPISVVPNDDPLVMGTQNYANIIQPNDAQAYLQTDTTNCPTTPTQPAPPPIVESVTSEVGSTSQPNVPHADQQQELQNPSTDPFDNEEEYVGVDDEHLVGVSIPEPAVVQALATTPDEKAEDEEAEDDMDISDVKHLIQQEEEVTDMPIQYNVATDPYNADIKVGALFPDIVTFRKAIRHHAVVKDFELAKVRTDSTRFMANCSYPSCPWRIHASRLRDQQVVMIKKIPSEHNCPTTKLVDSRMATQGWVAEKLVDWVKKNPGEGAKAAKTKLEGDFNFKLKYSKAWAGMKIALEQMHGKYEDSFQLLFNWKAEIEKRCPGSIVEIDLVKEKDKYYFNSLCSFQTLHRWFLSWMSTIHRSRCNCTEWQICWSISISDRS